MNITCVKGERILLTDNCLQIFSGVVKSVNADLGRVVLAEIIKLPENKKITGYRNFDKAEIVEIRKCENDTSVTLNGHQSNGDEGQRNKGTQAWKLETKLSESEYEEIKKLQNEFRLIRDFGTNFHSALSLLKTCTMIGVYGKDISKGRSGRASVLAVWTPSNIFVFDVQGLGDEIFQKGLKDVLESPNTVKIVYDCRLLSDCLKQKHLVNLENVRDVEAEDIMVVFQERRMIRRHSRPLEYLCKIYLGVELEESLESGEAWRERPLPQKLIEHLVSSVSFLVPLQKAIERKYLQLLISASNLYNNHLRNLDFFNFLHNQPEKTLRKEICKLLTPQLQARSDCRLKKVS